MATLLPPTSRWLKPRRIDESRARGETVSKRSGLRWGLLAGLILVAGVSLFYRLGSFRTFGSHEAYAVVPAREMLQSDNWVFPTYGGLPRLRKPPLVYWMIAGSAKFCGELSPLSARLPSTVAGLLLAGLMGIWAGRWYDSATGWAAAFVQLTTVWFVIFARKAEIDMVLCLFTTTALFLVADQPFDETKPRASRRWLGIFFLLSLAWLAKFHYGPALIVAPVAVFFVVQGRPKCLKNFLHPLGLACFAAAVFIWPMLVLDQAPQAWEIWRRETVGRALGEMGKSPSYFYLPYLVWLPMPWTIFALAAGRSSWRSAWKEGDPKERFLWIWFLVQFAILTVSANKHKHYLLALLPVLTLLASRSLVEVLRGFRQGTLRITRHWLGPLMAINLVIGVGLLILLQNRWPELSGAAWILGITLSCCEGAGWLLLYHRRVAAVVALNIVSLVIGGVVITEWIVPHCDRRVDVQAFAEDIRDNVLPGERVCVYCMDRDPLVYHLGSPVFRVESREQLKRKLQRPAPLYVVGYEKFINELSDLARTDALARLPQGQRDREPVEGDLVLVKLLPRHTPGHLRDANSPSAN